MVYQTSVTYRVILFGVPTEGLIPRPEMSLRETYVDKILANKQILRKYWTRS